MCMYLHTCILTLDKSNLFSIWELSRELSSELWREAWGEPAQLGKPVYRKKLCKLDETKDAKLIFVLTTRGTFISFCKMRIRKVKFVYVRHLQHLPVCSFFLCESLRL